MCIIGFGRMGKAALRVFSPRFNVAIISRRNAQPEIEKALAKADYVFLAVPIEGLDHWVPQINELSKPGSVVMDCCTIRQAANDKLSRIERRHFGLPEIGGQELPVDGEPDPVIRNYLKEQGCRLYPIETEGKPVMGIAHFIGMALDLNLTEEERVALSRAGSGRYLLQLIEHLKTNSPSTYKETQLLDLGMSARRKEVIEWLKNMDDELSRGEFRFKPYPPDRWRE